VNCNTTHYRAVSRRSEPNQDNEKHVSYVFLFVVGPLVV